MELKNFLLTALPSVAFGQQWLPFDQSLPCLINPITSIQAGESLQFQLFNSRNLTCEATLSFANPEYLPISWLVSPRNCAGDQFATFNVPCGSPNGTVAVQWHCAGHQTSSCALLNITGGTGNHEELQLEQENSTPAVTCQNGTNIMQTIGFTPISSDLFRTSAASPLFPTFASQVVFSVPTNTCA